MKKDVMAHIFYNDTLWMSFYIMNALYSLGQVMVKYNYSSVADTNPISVALHGGFYIICAVVVYNPISEFRFVRCGFLEAIYFILKIFIFIPEFSSPFFNLFIVRVICIAVGALMSCTIFRKQYREMKEEVNDANPFIVIPVAVLSAIIFIVAYHKYLILMVVGAFLSVICLALMKAMAPAEVGGTSGTNIKSRNNTGNEYQPSYSGDNEQSQERIAFSQYDPSRGNMADDIHRIDF